MQGLKTMPLPHPQIGKNGRVRGLSYFSLLSNSFGGEISLYRQRLKKHVMQKNQEMVQNFQAYVQILQNLVQVLQNPVQILHRAQNNQIGSPETDEQVDTRYDAVH